MALDRLTTAAPTTRTGQPVRAILVHPASIVRAGIASVIAAAGVRIVVSSASVAGAIESGVQHPELALIAVGDRDPAQTAAMARELWPMSRRVALVPGDITIAGSVIANETVHAAVAIDLAETEALIEAVKAVLNGESNIVAGVPEMADGRAAAAGRAEAAGLTARERELLYLIGEGLSNAEIATALFLSRKTVETHRTNLSRKLRIRSRAGLMRFAMDEWGGASR